MSKKKRGEDKKESLTKEELFELMNMNIQTYKKVKGRIRSNE